MGKIDVSEMRSDLQSGESVVDVTVPDGFFSGNSGQAFSPVIATTDLRILFFERRGAFKKRCDLVASWDLTEFELRTNRNEGSALGSFLYGVALFPLDGEMWMAGFKSERDRERFNEVAHNAIATAAGLG